MGGNCGMRRLFRERPKLKLHSTRASIASIWIRFASQLNTKIGGKGGGSSTERGVVEGGGGSIWQIMARTKHCNGIRRRTVKRAEILQKKKQQSKAKVAEKTSKKMSKKKNW